MELLTVSGPLTATELADRLDETPANCSWHLRKLAEHHFVEEAGGGIGRQRPWQVRSVGLAWDEGDASPGELRAGRALEELLMERQVSRLHAARAQLRDDGDEIWSDATSVTQSASWLTADELAQPGAGGAPGGVGEAVDVPFEQGPDLGVDRLELLERQPAR